MKVIDPVIVATFGLCLSLWVLGMVLWSARGSRRSARVQQRLGLSTAVAAEGAVSPLWAVQQDSGQRALPRTFTRRLEAMFRAAGWEVTAGPILAVVLVVVLFAAVFSYVIIRNALLAVGVGAVVLTGFSMVLNGRIRRHEARFESQFADALQLAVRSLRAGLPLVGTLRLVADEMGPPVGRMFAEICQQHNLGISIEEALHKTAQSSTSRDLQLFTTSVSIHTRSGGNLADMMERLAVVIRERMKLGRRVRVLSSQTQLSKRILLGLPFVLFGVLQIVNPSYVEPFYETSAGHMMIGISVVLLALGSIVMNRIATLEP